MNYYQHHIGDYRRDTAHLSLLEHGVYRQLLDWYYLSEEPIPEITEVVFRRLSAKTDEEKKAVETVLSEFFFVENGYRHRRCDKEIELYKSKAERARANGKSGGRPSITKVVISGFQEKTQTKANQEPLTINQEPLTNKHKEKDLAPTALVETPPTAEVSTVAKRDAVPIQEVVNTYHEILPMLPRVEKITKSRAGYIRQRTSEDLPDIESWKRYFRFVARSKFLTGKAQATNGRAPFRADIEFLCKPGSFTKIAENKYHEASER